MHSGVKMLMIGGLVVAVCIALAILLFKRGSPVETPEQVGAAPAPPVVAEEPAPVPATPVAMEPPIPEAPAASDEQSNGWEGIYRDPTPQRQGGRNAGQYHYRLDILADGSVVHSKEFLDGSRVIDFGSRAGEFKVHSDTEAVRGIVGYTRDGDEIRTRSLDPEFLVLGGPYRRINPEP